MLSHDFNDLLVLKHEVSATCIHSIVSCLIPFSLNAGSQEEGIFKDVPKKVDLAAPEDDVRVPDLYRIPNATALVVIRAKPTDLISD